MKAVQFEAGGPEKLYVGEKPIPELKDKEILIKVYATAINRADTLQVKQQKYLKTFFLKLLSGIVCICCIYA